MRAWSAGCLGLLWLAACSEPDPNRPREPERVRDDLRIETEVGEMFLKDPVLRRRMDRIRIEVRNGILYLSGELASEEERQRALDLVDYVGGVRRVEAGALRVRGP